MGRISDVVPSLYFTGRNDLKKFLEALDVEMVDLESKIRGIADLINVDTCPDDKLPYLAYLTGCPLVGENPSMHRRQLRDWPWLLKIKGTKRSLNVYLNSINAMNHRIPTYFRDAEGNYVETKPVGEPFEKNGLWYNIRTHYFGIETVWQGQEYTRWQEWHEDFVERVSWWLKRMKPFHAELLRWVTTVELDGQQNLYHGAGTFQGRIHNIGANRCFRGKMALYHGGCVYQGKIIQVKGVK